MDTCVLNTQKLLKMLGFDPGPIDGLMGRRTQSALDLAFNGTEPGRHDTDRQVSPQGRIKLMQHEAVMLDAYKDSVGVWTIGVGHTAAAGAPIPGAGMLLAIDEVFDLLERDLRRYEHDVVVALAGAPVNEHQFDALTSFHYNTGGIGRAKLMDHVRAGNMEAAAQGFLGWLSPPEIESRRREEKSLFETGEYGDLSTVPMYPITNNHTPRWSGRTNIPAPHLIVV